MVKHINIDDKIECVARDIQNTMGQFPIYKFIGKNGSTTLTTDNITTSINGLVTITAEYYIGGSKMPAEQDDETYENKIEVLHEMVERNIGAWTKQFGTIDNELDDDWCELMIGELKNRPILNMEINFVDRNSIPVMTEYFNKKIGERLYKQIKNPRRNETNKRYTAEILYIKDDKLCIEVSVCDMTPSGYKQSGTDRILGTHNVNLRFVEDLSQFWNSVENWSRKYR